MVKGRVAPPKCLFYVAIYTERYTLIEQSAHLHGLGIYYITPHIAI